MGDIVVILILSGLVCAALYYMWKRRGKNTCGGDCGSCATTCNLSENLKKARAELALERSKREKNKEVEK